MESGERSGGGGGFGGPRRFGGPRPFRPSPVRVGDEYDVRIESMSRRGDSGVARIQGLVVFVAGAKVGDSLRIRITKVGSGYASAEPASAAEAGGEPLPSEGETETSGDSNE